MVINLSLFCIKTAKKNINSAYFLENSDSKSNIFQKEQIETVRIWCDNM